MHGRHVIITGTEEITAENLLNVLNDALLWHGRNRSEIIYLWNYYCGLQPILERVKEVRPEICNTIVENRAFEIVDFKTGFLFDEPIQYISSRGESADNQALLQLNHYIATDENEAENCDLADWFHICGTAFRSVMPHQPDEENSAPFELTTLNPMNTFVVYERKRKKPVLGVNYVTDDNGNVRYSCYTEHQYFEVFNTTLTVVQNHILGGIPIIEYPLNMARIGAFEVVLPLLDAINLAESDRLDGVEQFVQSLLAFHNVDIDEEGAKALRDLGIIKYRDVDNTMKGEVEFLNHELNQTQTEVLVEHMYNTVLTICNMPNRNGGSSTSDTGKAVQMRDGWSSAKVAVKRTERIFKRSERRMLKILLNICRVIGDIDLQESEIGIRFTRANYEDIQTKAQVLDLLLKNGKVHPSLAFEYSELFTDPATAYAISAKYYEEQQEKQQAQARLQENSQAVESTQNKQDVKQTQNN